MGPSGRILRGDGVSWGKMTSPTPYVLNGVWGTSASAVFAVGYGPTILHYDGTSWTAQTPPAGIDPSLRAVWGRSGSDVYAVGDWGTVIHFDGNAWSQLPLPAAYVNQHYHSVWGAGPAISTWVVAWGGSCTTTAPPGPWRTGDPDIGVFVTGQDGTIIRLNYRGRF